MIGLEPAAWSGLVPLPVVIPLFAAGLTLALYRYPRWQRLITTIALTAVLLVSVTLLALADSGPIVVDVGGWVAPVGIPLVADRLAALMLTVSAIVILCVLLYSLGQGHADGDEQAPVAIYHPTYLVLAAGVANTFLAGDLFNMFVGFEILLAASFVLLTLGGSRSRIRAGTVYVIVAMVASTLFLVAIGLIYSATGTVNLAQLAMRLDEIDPSIAIVCELLLLLAFGVKAAVFPLSAWLPDSYPTAPAPVTAVFAGLLTKVGVYAILRTETLLFPGEQLRDLLLVAALATMVVGILGAIVQSDLKRLLSFTLVSHIGFMLFGIGLGSEAGLAGSVFYVVHHITVQTVLFLVAGLVERHGGTTSLERLGGLARLAPFLALLFFVSAMNLAGIPPMSGFLGKVGLIQAGISSATPLAWVLVAGSVVTSLLTLYAVSRAWTKAFWQAVPAGDEPVKLPRGMMWPTAGLVAAMVGITFVAGPLYGYTTRAAADLTARTAYVDSVLPGDAQDQELADPVDAEGGEE